MMNFQEKTMPSDTFEMISKDKYSVKEVFGSFQGEGAFSGYPAVFLRFAGCNLRCKFCDTDYTGGIQYNLETLLGKLNQTKSFAKEPILVITGGEPFLQITEPLLDMVMALFPTVVIQTNGTIFNKKLSKTLLNYFNIFITCSPKTTKINPYLKKHINFYSYTISDNPEHNFKVLMGEEENYVYRPTSVPAECIYVQLLDKGEEDMYSFEKTKNIQEVCARLGYNLDVQKQKIFKIR